jgi:hypothetical protein
MSKSGKIPALNKFRKFGRRLREDLAIDPENVHGRLECASRFPIIVWRTKTGAAKKKIKTLVIKVLLFYFASTFVNQ